MSHSMTSLQGKVALVTGASKGIGRATALRLGESGARMIIAATSIDLLQTLRKDLEGIGVECLDQRCDVTRLSDCESLIRQSLDRFGTIDILVNNAGVGFSGKIVESDPEQAEQMVKVNILGVYHMTRTVLPSMIEKRSGDIVNIGSVAGVKYSPNFSIYSATKFAVRAFSEALRNEVQEHNIRVTLVHPGMTDTPFFDSFAQKGSPVPLDKDKILRPGDIADAIHHALTRPDGVSLNEMTVRPTWQER
ncbi:MAG: SDR family oxidoreductase [Deltaproteobacteria bacterium]|nr:SDR family oxidoreductase [Deltaproteobacteria bacterium]